MHWKAEEMFDIQNIPQDEVVTAKGLKLSIMSSDLWVNNQPTFSISSTTAATPPNKVQLSVTLEGSVLFPHLDGASLDSHILDANAMPDLEVHLFRDDLSEKSSWNRSSLILERLGSGVMVGAQDGPAWGLDKEAVKYFVVVGVGGVRVKSKVRELLQVY